MLWNLLAEAPPSLEGAEMSTVGIYLCKSSLIDFVLSYTTALSCRLSHFVLSCVNTVRQVNTSYLLASEPPSFHSSFLYTGSPIHCGLIFTVKFSRWNLFSCRSKISNSYNTYVKHHQFSHIYEIKWPLIKFD